VSALVKIKRHTANIVSLINLLTVEWYGETEFWAALGKVLLIIGEINQPHVE
jgi:L-asparagine transporter-like permease